MDLRLYKHLPLCFSFQDPKFELLFVDFTVELTAPYGGRKIVEYVPTALNMALSVEDI